MKRIILSLFIISVTFISCKKTHNESFNNSDKTTTINKMDDIDLLLNNLFPFVEDLLQKYGEFYPLASAVNQEGEIVNVGTYDGDDNPQSNKVIDGLKKGFIAKQSEYRTVCIFFDVLVESPITKLKSDAIAVFVESKNENTAYLYYYPYKITKDGEIIYSESWKTDIEKEIFLD